MDTVLSQTEFAYNNSVNQSFKRTFEVAYGYRPQHVDLVPLLTGAQTSNNVETYVDHIRRIHQEVCEATKASNKYKAHTNLHQRAKEFNKGDLVIVYL